MDPLHQYQRLQEESAEEAVGSASVPADQGASATAPKSTSITRGQAPRRPTEPGPALAAVAAAAATAGLTVDQRGKLQALKDLYDQVLQKKHHRRFTHVSPCRALSRRPSSKSAKASSWMK